MSFDVLPLQIHASLVWKFALHPFFSLFRCKWLSWLTGHQGPSLQTSAGWYPSVTSSEVPTLQVLSKSVESDGTEATGAFARESSITSQYPRQRRDPSMAEINQLRARVAEKGRALQESCKTSPSLLPMPGAISAKHRPTASRSGTNREWQARFPRSIGVRFWGHGSPPVCSLRGAFDFSHPKDKPRPTKESEWSTCKGTTAQRRKKNR